MAIEKRGKGKYVVRIDLGIGLDGKRQRVNKTVNGTKRDAERVQADLLRERDMGGHFLASRNMTFEDYADVWLDAAQASVKITTLRVYQDYVERYYLGSFGHMRLSDISLAHIQPFYNHLIEEGISPVTLRNIHSTLSGIFESAVNRRLLVFNPTKGAQLPKQDRADIVTLTRVQAQAFGEEIRGVSVHAPFFLFLLYTGVRPGEALALRWQDIADDVAHIHRHASYVNGRGWDIGKTKTLHARRKVDLIAPCVESLADIPQRHTLIFANAKGRPTHLSTYAQAFRRALRRMDLPKMRVYDLRHTYATLMLESGVDYKTLSQQLGHKNPAFTMDRYVHPSMEHRRKASEAFGQYLST